MTANDTLNRIVRPLIVVGGVIPGLVITWRLFQGEYVNPAEALEHATGFSALWFLLASLSATPLRQLTGLAGFSRLRRPLGLWAFSYGVVHLNCYLIFDQSLLWSEIGADIVERPYITVGFSAFLILLVLAATSPARVVKRLGGRRWRAIHRWAYVAAVLAVFHFLWLVKKDITEPFLAAMTLILLLAIRSNTRSVSGQRAASAPAAAKSG